MALGDCTAELIAAINDDELENVKSLLISKKVDVNCQDQHKVTPLQQAAFRGRYEICKLLLEAGADVNSTNHPHGYTALIFGALSGDPKLCRLLLDAGAKLHCKTVKNRGALDVASFTGQYKCICVMQLYVPYEMLQPFINDQGKECERKLSQSVGTQLHQLVAMANWHPIGMFLFLYDHPDLLTQASQVQNALEGLMEAYLHGNDMDEILALKMCLQFNTFKDLLTSCENDASSVHQQLPKFIKHMLSKDSNGINNVDNFTVSAVMKFPKKESILFHHFVKEVFQGTPSTAAYAYDVVCKFLMGPRILEEEQLCNCCGEWMEPLKFCGSCRQAKYCSARCQKFHWPIHKVDCRKEPKADEETK